MLNGLLVKVERRKELSFMLSGFLGNKSTPDVCTLLFENGRSVASMEHGY